MSTSLKHVFAKIALGGWLLLGSAGIATAAGKDMLYLHNFTATETATLMPGGKNAFGLYTQKLPSGRTILAATPETRFEAELQGTLKDITHHTAATKELDALAADAAKAEAMFGKGYTIVKLNKPPRDVWDEYFDSKDGLLAGTNASLRVRTENGFSALNFKPGSRVDFANGMTHRIEAGIKIEPFVKGKPTSGQLALFGDAKAAYNPLREFAKQYPGRKVSEVFEPSVEIQQKRTMYEIQKDGVRHGEVSVDIVEYRDPANPSKKGTLYRIEMEGDHLNANPTASQKANSAVAPHDATDTLDPNNDKNPDIIELHRLNDILVGLVKAKPAGMAKVTEARMRLGKPIAKTATQAGTLRPSLAAKGVKVETHQAAKPVVAKSAKAPKR